MRIGTVVALCALFGSLEAKGSDAATQQDVPWWKKNKLVFMWGKWPYTREDKSQDYYYADLPRDLFRNIAQAGATVFADCVTGTDWVQENDAWVPSIRRARRHARYAHEFGLKYFNTLVRGPSSSLDSAARKTPGARMAIRAHGKPSGRCPLDESIYNKWIVDPHLELAREGLLDGIHVGWEGSGEAATGGREGFCYCNECFSNFLGARGVKSDLPEKDKRFQWVDERNLMGAYEEHFRQQRLEMFTRIRERLHALKPDLLFSSYGMGLQMSSSDFMRAMHTPEAPFIYLDHARNYGNDDRQTWWMSSNAQMKNQGYLYLPGGWTNPLFGAQSSQVDAARWIYEAAVNEDGVWLWFEREIDDEILRAYAAADSDIKAVENAVGDFLFNGEKEYNFVTMVEWTGRPELARAVIAYTYHLRQDHLAHITNVDAEWPARTRIRFPRLRDGERWTLRDPMSELYYTPNGKSAIWTTAQLRAGVVVAMKPRSDVFLLISPAPAGALEIDRSRLLHSREFNTLPDHKAAAAQAGPVKAMIRLYLMKNSIHDQELESLMTAAKKITDFPKSGWHFKMDKDDMGPGEGWFLPTAPLDGWEPAEIAARWKGGIGAGWYRADVDIPAPPEGKRVYLYFGAVDEELVVWIDGKYAGDYMHPRGADYGWNKPFAIDVTDKLTPPAPGNPGSSNPESRHRHHLALRVYNSVGAGGVWKPVSAWIGPAIEDAASTESLRNSTAVLERRLVYTASESMGFGGNGEGEFTIGNAIRTVEEDGSNQQRVRQLRGHLWSPSFSPDGKQIAYVHDTGGRGQIWVMNADGSDAVNISNNSFCDRGAAWSPDGNRIAFRSDRESDWDIYVMDANGSRQRRLAGHPGLDRSPIWSPDGERIAWESQMSGVPQIWICDADGKSSWPLIAPGKPIRIQQIVQRGQQFHRYDLENPFPDNTFYVTDPAWSPDGNWIAAVINGQDCSRGVIIDADGSSMLKLGYYNSDNYVWSPDGQKLACTVRPWQETERSSICVIYADRSEELTDWSQRAVLDVTPQGPRLGGAGRAGFVTWYSHGSAKPRRVLKSFYSLAWSADSKTLAFSSDIDPDGAFYVYTIGVDGGEPMRLETTKSAWPQQIMWQP